LQVAIIKNKFLSRFKLKQKMEVLKTVQAVRSFCKEHKNSGKTIGLVPTMGALHEGHISLVKKCKKENNITIVSIFINPEQFNNKNDFRNYPHDIERDLKILKEQNTDCVFVPPEEEIYPAPDYRMFNFGTLDKSMEGAFRPGHFNGVAKVVSRLFQIIEAQRAYFGEKDFQQLAIIKQMVKFINLPVEVRSCPTVRNSDGLAQSSRNALLNPQQRTHASLISKVLFEARDKKDLPVEELKNWVATRINENPFLEVEYFEIADIETLQPVRSWENGNGIIGCIAVKTGNVRLIDNVFFK